MTGPYKSKLFNFLNRQSLNLGDKLSHAARQVKIAVEWGVQILIYPLYLLIQAGRMAGYQLKQRSLKQLTAASVPSVSEKIIPDDRPLIAAKADYLIESILQEVEPWLSSTEVPENPPKLPIPPLAAFKATASVNASLQPSENLIKKSSLNSALVIQGVANSLENRSLVLVTPDNEILDLLSQQQQQQLQQRICTEIANYYYLQKLQQNAAQQFSILIPTFVTENDHILPPVRWFWQTIRWVQNSQLATTLNLFGESRLVYLEKPVSQALSLKTTPIKTPPIVWIKLDKTLAELEVLNETASLAELLREAWQKLIQTLKNSWNSDLSLNSSEPDPFQIQAIIQAAIDYFFGQSSNQFKLSENQFQKVLMKNESKTKGKLMGKPTLNQPLLAAADDDPWLSWDDLFIDTNSPNPPTFSDSLTSLNPSMLPRVSQPSQNSLAETLKRNLKQQKTIPKALQIRQENPQDLVKPIIENLAIEKNTEINDSNISPIQKETRRQGDKEKFFNERMDFSPSASPASPAHLNPESKKSTLESPHPSQEGKGGIQNPFEDWIETEAKPVGYVKHPLEIVLEWLDRVILWLEEAIIQIWGWLRQRIQRKKKKKKNQ